MAICKSCDGVGSVRIDTDPQGREVAEECPICDGTGRLCGRCKESLPIGAPRGEECCRDCFEAMADDDRDARAEMRREAAHG